MPSCRNFAGLLTQLQNTGQEFDGSDSGARPDEAVSWGKIRAGSESIKVNLMLVFLRLTTTNRVNNRSSLMPHLYFLYL